MKKNKAQPSLNLIYVGDHFYFKSGSHMSSIYTKDFKRYDWGKVQIALANGQKINIRPATDKELVKAYKMLDSYQKGLYNA